MLRIYDVPTARKTILKRTPPDEFPISERVKQGIARIFGEPLTPEEAVTRILGDVRARGDTALRKWTRKLDGLDLEGFAVPPEVWQQALGSLPEATRRALEVAAERIRAFHKKQPLTSWITQDLGGTVGQLIRPIPRVGLYVPGGTAPLPSTVLMSAIPARVAGVPQVVVVTPPHRGNPAAFGHVHPAILAACAIAGVDAVYTLGGAQAIAALAYGTESVPAVDKIFGPGNLFVTLAKRRVFGVVGIDGLAGPTETLVIADESANPAWVAADLLAQAEHDLLASAILLTPSRPLAEAVQAEVAHQMTMRSRAEIIAASLELRGGIVLTRDLDEAVDLANEYAPEHLALSVREPWRLAERIVNAGGVFLGEHSYEVLGDYVAGPSHVMPTGGSARFASPLNVWDFVKIVSLVALDPITASDLAPTAVTLADAEGLDAHAAAARARIDNTDLVDASST
ncbi:MAG TPA: histidinol dehydrogenase [Anaerolineae bacterium]|nr:histidinol dehydrogenase [Anaerolineae bacterium]HIQ08698.1 histidinol dehydrogenase [Anaerolineaceae bacterium]